MPQRKPLPNSAESVDLTQEVCPALFLKAMLALEGVEPGGGLELVLDAKSPLSAIAQGIKQEGYHIEAIHRTPDRCHLHVRSRS
ncbi:MAG: sulfurtransferase TusA family protein [bacterium]